MHYKLSLSSCLSQYKGIRKDYKLSVSGAAERERWIINWECTDNCLWLRDLGWRIGLIHATCNTYCKSMFTDMISWLSLSM